MVRKIAKHQTGRFAMVGIAATSIDFTLLLLLDALTPLPVLLANAAATAVAFCFSFVANKKYTFRTRGTNLVREITLFVSFTLFGLWVLQSVVIHFALPATQEMFDVREVALMAAKLIATLVSTVWNFVTYSKFVFVHNKMEADE